MKNLISYVLFISFLAIVSCSDDKDTVPDPKLKFSILFKGNIGSEDVSFETTGNANVYDGLDDLLGGSICIKDDVVNLYYPARSKGMWGMKLQLQSVDKKLYNIQGDQFQADSSMVSFEYKDMDSHLSTYLPLKTPLKINVTRYQIYEKLICPTIEGSIKGVLYNKENLQDSITVKNFTFEIH